MREVGLRSDQESEEGLKATIHWPELLTADEGVDEDEDEDGDIGGDDDGDEDEDSDRKCVNPCFIKQKPALLQSH